MNDVGLRNHYLCTVYASRYNSALLYTYILVLISLKNLEKVWLNVFSEFHMLATSCLGIVAVAVLP